MMKLLQKGTYTTYDTHGRPAVYCEQDSIIGELMQILSEVREIAASGKRRRNV